MRTPADDQFPTTTDPVELPPRELGRLIRHHDPASRHLGLALLTERLAARPPSDDAEAAGLAALLPTTLTGPPEADLLLAGLHERAGHDERFARALEGRPRPPWRAAGTLPASVRTAWLRADLLHDPAAALREEPPGEPLYQAVRGADITAARHPARLVAELAAGTDPVLRAEAVRLARQGLYAGLLAPAQARAALTGLLGTGGAEAVTAALDGLAEPWAALDPLPPGLLAPFLRTGARPDPAAGADPGTEPAPVPESVAGAALTVAARHGHRDLLRRAAEDPALAPALRRRAMELLGDLAGRADIGALTALAARDPLLLGAPAVACLRGLHRRGHFPDGPDVPVVVGLALTDHSIAPHDVATVLFTVRRDALRVLTGAPADDPDWPRRLALLTALAAQGAGDLPVGAAVTRLLPAAPAPGPFLDAIRELRHTDAEEAVLALLPSAPDAALETLEAIGGDRTVLALREGLGLDTATGGQVAPPLRPVRHRALELLWQLDRDPERRRALLARLDPVDLPPRIAAGLGRPDPGELALLRSHLDPDRPDAALCRLAAHGDADTLPALADLLLRVVSALATAREPGAPDRTGEHGRPAGEPVVPQEVLDALHGLGRRLHGRGAIRPVCLLTATDADGAGHALVANLALELLDRPGLLDHERVILLELLLRTPWTGTRARVHRLTRHRDRHVRKHAIALLARDATGEDAQALSATLIALTRARDVQTVRQALLALGHARAHWAGAAIADRLDHPNMNIRKTAAAALVRTGGRAAVPGLLDRLGREDNPALRDTLVEALRTVLGEAHAATLLAAAEHARPASVRERLLLGLSGALGTRAIRALAEQESPVAPPLLALLASGRVRPATGTLDDLAAALARHGITVPSAGPPPPAPRAADRDAGTLLAGGWDAAVALRLAGRDEMPAPGRTEALRPLLADWLRLAASPPVRRDPALRNRVVRYALRICPGPRSTAELGVYARFAPVLLAALADARDRDRHDLVAVLEAAAPLLTASARTAATIAVRALRPAPAAPARSTVPLLRLLGAVPVRADLDRDLAAARLGADPWRGATTVLRAAFAVPEDDAPLPAGARAWREALEEAARTPEELARFRARDDGTVPSRDRLAALAEAHQTAGPGVRTALVDWMTLLQPLDAPPWTLAETARVPAPRPRRIRGDDLDQPRSAAQRERLLALLDAPGEDRRRTAALTLARWPEPGARLPVLRAYLRGRVDLPVDTGLARALPLLDPAELRAGDVLRDRVAHTAARLGPQDLERLVPLLLEWWRTAPPAGAGAIRDALRACPADALATLLADRPDGGDRGSLDLLAGRPLLRTRALERARRRLREEGHGDLADRLLLVDGPLRGPDAARHDAAALAALRERREPAPAASGAGPSRQELLELAATGTPEQICRALTALAEAHPGPAPDDDPRLSGLLAGLLTHPRARVRLRAHRTSRAMLDRPAHLDHTRTLLDDPSPDVVRMAVRTLCRAAWTPALPAVTGLLGHPHPAVRDAAAEGLAALGTTAVPALRAAAARARPDRRARYTDVLDRIGAGGSRPGAPRDVR
ncbi:HEAT repeat domain-containing protein [Streptomyces sp. NPDC001274]